MSRAELAAIASVLAESHGVADRDRLIALGLSERQLSRLVADGVLTRIGRRGFRFAGSQSSFEQRVGLAIATTGGVASHTTAGRLWGWRRCVDDLIHVTVPPSPSRQRPRGPHPPAPPASPDRRGHSR